MGRLGTCTGMTLCVLLVAGCVAQQADLKRMEGTFDRKLTNVDQRERQLQQNIEEALQRIDQQRKEAEQLVSEARARLRQDIRDIRGEELPKLQGRLEETDHHLKRNRERVDNVQHRVESLTQVLMKQQAENDKRLGKLEETQRSQYASLKTDQQALQQQLETVRQTLHQDLNKLVARVEALSPALASLAKKVDAQLAEQDRAISENRSQGANLSKQLAEVSGQFVDYRKALESFGEKVVKQDARISEVSQDAARQTATLQTKMESDLRELTGHLAAVTDSMGTETKGTLSHLEQVNKKVEEDAAATAAYLAEVNKSVTSVADALKSTSTEMMARIDAQDARLRETTTQVGQVTDNLTKLAQSLEEMQGRATARVDAHEQQLKETAQQLGEVNESVTSLAEAMRTLSQGVMERVQAQDERLKEATQSLQAVKTRLEAIDGAPSQPRRTPGQPSKSETGASSREVTVGSTTSSSRRADDRAVLERQARERYERLLGVFMEGDLDGAREGFLEFLMKFPNSTRAPNAQYWLGECYYGKKQYQEAIRAFERVVVKYPESNKAPAALLKKGYAQLALNNHQQAKATLQDVVKSYPQSPEAQKATDRLSHLK